MNKNLKLLCTVAGLLTCARMGFADAWENLPNWKMGANPCVPEEIENIVRDTPVNNRSPLEDKLIAVLSAANSTTDAKAYCCRMLQRLGTDKCVPVLARLLGDADLSHYARLGLEGMQSSEAAGNALRTALDTVPDTLKPGVLGSVAARHDEKAVAQIKALAAGANKDVAAAAIGSLGRIGGKTSLQALQSLKTPDALKAVRQDAMLACAESVSATDAAPVYRDIYAGPCGRAQHAAALRGLVRTDEAKACGLVVDTLKGNDLYMRKTALRSVTIDQGAALTRAVADALGSLGPDSQPDVIIALANRGDHAALDSVMKCLKSDAAPVRDAAMLAVGKLGDARDVGTLLELARTDAKALDAIAAMTDGKADDALVKALQSGTAPEATVKALTMRNYAKAAPELVKLIPSASAEVRNASWKGLRSLASEAELAPMLKLVGGIKNAEEQDLAAAAVKECFSRQPDKQKCLEALSRDYDSGKEATRLLILEIAQAAGGPQALKIVRGAMDRKNKALYDKALRVLAAWPDREAAPDLLQAAGNAPDDVGRLLALGGYIRMIGADANNPPAGEKVAMYRNAAQLTKRDDERRLILSGLANVKDADALKMLGDCLNQTGVRAEAETAAFQLADATKNQFPAEVQSLMQKIIATTTNQDVIKRARTYLPPEKN